PSAEELELLTADETESAAEAAAEAIQVPEGLAETALAPVSGLYARPPTISGLPISLDPAPRGILPIRKEEIRLDVDGRYPQMAVSGTISGFLVSRIHWIARLRKIAPNRWRGAIWYKDGAAASFPYTAVDVTAIGGPFPSSRSVKIVYRAPGVPKRTVVYRYASAHYRTVNFEFDFQAGEIADTAIDTCAHPNRPASLPCETLTIPKVFQRVGCQVTTNAGSPVPSPPGATWSDMEMHDAMQIHWSRFANKAQWAMWIFYASMHEAGTGLGGIMFDDIGPNHRQGTALFVDSFIAQPPANEPAADRPAWIDRMRFWTAVHEMGHAFNLAHSWQKSLGTPWVPLANEPEARSFMNYPYNVAGGQAAFFSNFEFRFSDPELLFIRHAPERFVQMGNAAWFDHHGFEEASAPEEPTMTLELRVNREAARYEFMEPVWLELKLTNTGRQPRLVDSDVLDADSLTVILKKEGKDARQLVPFRQKCVAPETKALMPGESIYGTVLASAGLNGWDVAEPGTYMIQAAAHIGDEDIVSAPFTLRIAPPVTRDEEYSAGDLFTQDAARVLVFGGSRFLDGANDLLHEVVERFPDRRIALHARVALGNPLTIDYKQVLPTEDGLELEIASAQPDEAAKLLRPALVTDADVAAETFGHIRYRGLAVRAARRLATAGAETEATKTIDSVIKTLDARIPDDRPVKPQVLEELNETRETIAGTKKSTRTRTKGKAKAKA
ncbi:MAG TPA: hypothetical protein VFT18_01785, partial [Gaiellaceae bacterium]|nr:hypothetical protein [Gaiellaceae bacterium]